MFVNNEYGVSLSLSMSLGFLDCYLKEVAFNNLLGNISIKLKIFTSAVDGNGDVPQATSTTRANSKKLVFSITSFNTLVGATFFGHNHVHFHKHWIIQSIAVDGCLDSGIVIHTRFRLYVP